MSNITQFKINNQRQKNMENMEINDSKNYQNYFNIISSKYLHEPNSEYKFTVQNINSIGKESVDSDEDILNQKPKKITQSKIIQ